MIQIDGFYLCGGSQADLIFDPQGEAQRPDTYCIFAKHNKKTTQEYVFFLWSKSMDSICVDAPRLASFSIHMGEAKWQYTDCIWQSAENKTTFV